MRLVRYLLLVAVVLSLDIQAQDLQICIDKKGKVGFADKNGNVIIECAYESALPFSDGRAIVSKGGKYGMIDEVGKVLLPTKYTQITPWTDELDLVKNGKTMGLADHKGQLILPVKYSHVSTPNCYGKALIALGGRSVVNEGKSYMSNAKYGIVDTAGKILIEAKYKGLFEFAFDGTNNKPYHEGKRLLFSYHYITDTLTTDCSYLGFAKTGFSIYGSGILDANGNELIQPGLYYFVMQPKDGMVRYYNVKKNNVQCGYHNLTTGKSFQAAQFTGKLDDISFWTHGDFKGELAPVNGTTWSFVDKDGQTLKSGFSSILYNEVSTLWGAKDGSDKWQVFDCSNKDVAALSGFDDIKFPAHEGDKEVFMVKKNGKYGGVDRQGHVVVPFDYSASTSNTYDVIIVKKNDKWGAISPNNEKLIPVEFTDVVVPTQKNTKDFWVKKPDGLFYHYSLGKKNVSGDGYKVVFNFVNDLAYVVPKDIQVEESLLNRAQIYAPNADKSKIDAVSVSEHVGAFVNIVNVNDEMVFDMPVSTMYMEQIRKEVEKRGGRKLSKSEMKSALLEATKSNRSYDLQSVLGEDEWNY